MEDLKDDTYDEMLSACAEIVESNETYDEMVASCSQIIEKNKIFKKIVNEEPINNLCTTDDTSKQSNSQNFKIDFLRITRSFVSCSKLIMQTESYISKLERQLINLRSIETICEIHQLDQLDNVECGADSGLHGLVYGSEAVTKGSNMVIFNHHNNNVYLFNEENYRKLEILLNRMTGMMNNLINDADEHQKIITEILDEAHKSSIDRLYMR